MPKFQPVILSLLDDDLYKFTMLQALLHAFPGNTATYRFVCRNKPLIPLGSLVDEVNAQLDHLCTLRFAPDELAYLATRPYLKSDLIEFLRIFQLHRPSIRAWAEGDELHIEAQGSQVHIMLFEIYVLAIVNEVYFRALGGQHLDEGHCRLMAKIELLKRELPKLGRKATPFEFFEFGLRRRYSREWQREVVATLKRELPEHFRGTSSVLLAKELGLAPIGTMAHEYLQTFQAVGVQLQRFQRSALEAWAQEFRGDLGIALTDVVGMDAFCKDFDLYFAKLFDGQRNDSGDPFEWGEKALAHYARLRINPLNKRLVWSNDLTIPRALELYERFGDRVQCGFGIGTNLSNDLGPQPLSIVMKLVRCNGLPVAKLPDSPGKTLCDDPHFLKYLAHVFDRPLA